VVACKRFTGFVMSLLYCNSIFKAPTRRGFLFAFLNAFAKTYNGKAKESKAAVINH